MSKNSSANIGNITGVLISSIFGGIGLIFTIIGVLFLVTHFKTSETAIPVDALITRIDYHPNDEYHDVHVKYTIDGETISLKLNEYSSDMHEGDVITLYYQEDNIYDVEVGGFNLFMGAIFGGIGVVFLIVGIVFIKIEVSRRRMKKWLMENGRQIYAEIVDVQQDYSTTINNKHPSYIVCNERDVITGEVAIYESESIMNDNLSELIGTSALIYVHPDDNSKFYVDLDGLINKNSYENTEFAEV